MYFRFMDLIEIYKSLYEYFGPQYWWPLVRGKPRTKVQKIDKHYNYLFEICVGAILTQNTAWKNVERALCNLIEVNLLTPPAILKCPTVKLCKLIRPAGYFRQKCKKLKIFSKFLVENYNGDTCSLFGQKLIVNRQKLLSLWGIGPETADSIILYAGGQPSFVIDTYTRRLCECFGAHFKTYDEYKNFFENHLPRNTKLFNEYHALIVAWGKLYSKDKALALEIIGLLDD